MKAKDIPELSHLSVPGKILFIEDLWDSIVSNDSEVPIPESHKEELIRGLKNIQNHRESFCH